eukprot:754965-Hanusia_phi.AAC.2
MSREELQGFFSIHTYMQTHGHTVSMTRSLDDRGTTRLRHGQTVSDSSRQQQTAGDRRRSQRRVGAGCSTWRLRLTQCI